MNLDIRALNALLVAVMIYFIAAQGVHAGICIWRDPEDWVRFFTLVPLGVTCTAVSAAVAALVK